MKPILLLVHLGSPARVVPSPDPSTAGPPFSTPEPANQSFSWASGLLRVTATELFVAFDQNAAHAEHAYGGRPLAIVGAVERLLRRTDRCVVRLSVSGRPGAYLPCALLAGGAVGVERLRPGDIVLLAARRVIAGRVGAAVEHAILVDPDLAGVATGGAR